MNPEIQKDYAPYQNDNAERGGTRAPGLSPPPPQAAPPEAPPQSAPQRAPSASLLPTPGRGRTAKHAAKGTNSHEYSRPRLEQNRQQSRTQEAGALQYILGTREGPKAGRKGQGTRAMLTPGKGTNRERSEHQDQAQGPPEDRQQRGNTAYGMSHECEPERALCTPGGGGCRGSGREAPKRAIKRGDMHGMFEPFPRASRGTEDKAGTRNASRFEGMQAGAEEPGRSGGLSGLPLGAPGSGQRAPFQRLVRATPMAFFGARIGTGGERGG